MHLGGGAVWALILLFSACAFAKPQGDGVDAGRLFRLEKPGLPTSFVFGTIHSDDPRAVYLPEPIEQVFGESDALVMEVLLDEENREASRVALRFEDGRDLPSILGEPLYTRAVDAASNLGLPESAVRHLKPWALVTLLSVPVPKTGRPLDMVLYEMALDQGKEPLALERVDEQLTVFEDLSESDQVTLLRVTLDDIDEVEQRHEALLDLYLEGDLRALVELSHQYLRSADPQLVRRLHERAIVQRNRRMVRRLQPWLQLRSCFVAVGAMHLPGSSGMLQQLRNLGFEVSRVY